LSAVSGGEKEKDHQYLLEPLGEPHVPDIFRGTKTWLIG